MLTQGEDVAPIPGTTKLPVRLMLRSDQPRIFVETANILWTSRRIWAMAWEDQPPPPPPVDVQAVRDVVDKADVAQGAVTPRVA